MPLTLALIITINKRPPALPVTPWGRFPLTVRINEKERKMPRPAVKSSPSPRVAAMSRVKTSPSPRVAVVSGFKTSAPPVRGADH